MRIQKDTILLITGFLLGGALATSRELYWLTALFALGAVSLVAVVSLAPDYQDAIHSYRRKVLDGVMYAIRLSLLGTAYYCIITPTALILKLWRSPASPADTTTNWSTEEIDMNFKEPF